MNFYRKENIENLRQGNDTLLKIHKKKLDDEQQVSQRIIYMFVKNI